MTFRRWVDRTDDVEGPGVKWPGSGLTLELACRSVIRLPLTWKVYAPSRETGSLGFHGWPVITQVDDQLVEPRAPLVHDTITCMDFVEKSGHFITYDALRGVWLKPFLNKWPSVNLIFFLESMLMFDDSKHTS